ncbi:hypothetical protein BCV70DRAFT_46443 [Testicularia cyperi]|uniref:Uncharacterized protein n=1 Tax=Testicularia cyperi TaxID=1882483 RepID=A0A317XHT9_9BASI|nr:hypothetical protein BCV70DRAFT_46443 [Testicularia cyperi]
MEELTIATRCGPPVVMQASVHIAKRSTNIGHACSHSLHLVTHTHTPMRNCCCLIVVLPSLSEGRRIFFGRAPVLIAELVCRLPRGSAAPSAPSGCPWLLCVSCVPDFTPVYVLASLFSLCVSLHLSLLVTMKSREQYKCPADLPETFSAESLIFRDLCFLSE